MRTTIRSVRATASRIRRRPASRNARDEDYLNTLLAAVLRSDSNCVDVGAHKGSMLRRFKNLAPEGTHIAFEALPDSARELRRAHPDVTVHEVALSDSTGTRTFFEDVDHRTRSSLSPRSHQKTVPHEVHTARLDHRLPSGYSPTLLKIDVEGAELEVLQGARRTLAQYRPVVVFEHGRHAVEAFGVAHEQVHDELTAAGLRVFRMDGLLLSRTEFASTAAPDGMRFNFFAV